MSPLNCYNSDPAYFRIFPSSFCIILFILILVIITFSGDKCFQFVYVDQRELEGSTTEVNSTIPCMDFFFFFFCISKVIKLRKQCTLPPNFVLLV